MKLPDWIGRLLGGPRVALTPDQARAVEAWRALRGPGPRAALQALRWVVVDVESTGLDVWRDQLISIGAVAVREGAIQLADSLEVVLRQERVSDTANILVHGIGGTAQRSGLPPADALVRFLTYARQDPLAAFHAAFDTLLIGRALRAHLGLRWSPRVLDLADLMPALFPEERAARDLDDWLVRFGIGHYARHQALSDAYATAQLLQVALAEAGRRGIGDWAGLDRLQRAQRALSRMGATR